MRPSEPSRAPTHRADPLTSFDTSEALGPILASMLENVLDYATHRGSRGTTSSEAQRALKMLQQTVSTRLSQLVRSGQLVKCSDRRRNPRGVREAVYRIPRFASGKKAVRRPRVAKKSPRVRPVPGGTRSVDLVYDYVFQQGSTGATREEVERALELCASTAGAALFELGRVGWIVRTGDSRRNVTGHRGIVWRVVAGAG